MISSESAITHFQSRLTDGVIDELATITERLYPRPESPKKLFRSLVPWIVVLSGLALRIYNSEMAQQYLGFTDEDPFSQTWMAAGKGCNDIKERRIAEGTLAEDATTAVIRNPQTEALECRFDGQQ